MRLSTITKHSRARWSQPPVRRFLCYYSSSYSSSRSSIISSDHHHHRNRQRSYSHLRSSELYWNSSHNRISFSRRFSANPGAYESAEQFLPVETLISLLDSYHGVTGLPWWVIISSSTVVMRLAIFPLVVLQLKKLKMIGELLPQLPPPFPPPLSGRNLKDQITLFWKEKEAAGCPSVFWFFSSFAVQCPCFFLWLMSVRTMSLNHHPGFDSGGVLWFQNLTEYPHGVLGPVLPMCIAGLHFANVQLLRKGLQIYVGEVYVIREAGGFEIIAQDQHLSFKKSSLPSVPGTAMKAYKSYLVILTLPILMAAFSVPQGCLVYWLTNSTLTLTQQSCLRNPTVLKYLGLPKMNTYVEAPSVKKSGDSGVADIVFLTKGGEIHAQSLSPVELVNYSIKSLSDGRKDIAIRLLRLAIEKDPGFVKALLILGQTLVQNKQLIEAADCLESAISKLLDAGNPTEVEEVDLLILSSQWAGVANVQQGKMEQGLVHLERIAQLKEPEDSKSKSHYYDGLLVLSSALANVGREAEALKYLEMAAAYNPDYNVYIDQLKNDSNEIGRDLSNRMK